MSEVVRKIHFFQVVWVKNDGNTEQKDLNFINGILRSLYRKLIQLSDNESVFLDEYTPKFSSPKNMSFWRIAKIRKKDLPLKFDEKQFKDVPLGLQNHEGLFEPSHFIIFDGKIIGAEYNHNGVKWVNTKLVRLINEYLSSNPSDIARVEIKPIFKRDLYKLIDRFEEIKWIQLSIATPYARFLKEEDSNSFGEMFSAADLVDDMWLTIAFTLGVGKKRGDPSKFKKVIATLKKLFGRADVLANIRSARIRGRLEGSDTIETINLIEELLVSEKRVPKLEDRTGAVNPESMFREIIDSYNNFKEELKEFIRDA